jgi:hypothetical protein
MEVNPRPRGSALTSTSPCSSPARGRRPASAFTSEVLPHPVGPMMANSRPAGTEPDSPFRMRLVVRALRRPTGTSYVKSRHSTCTRMICTEEG